MCNTKSAYLSHQSTVVHNYHVYQNSARHMRCLSRSECYPSLQLRLPFNCGTVKSNICATVSLLLESQHLFPHCKTYFTCPLQIRSARLLSLPPNLLSNQGSWASVTGVADSIGRGFAQAFREYRFNAILHDRDRPDLSQVEKQLNTTRLFLLDATATTKDREESLAGLQTCTFRSWSTI